MLRKALVEAEPEDARGVADYAVYALDTTIAARPDADTVPDRSKAYSAERGKAIAGHQSWLAPREVQRVPTNSTPAEVGAGQVQRLAADPTPGLAKSVVVDSHYACPPFLGAFVGLVLRVEFLKVDGTRRYKRPLWLFWGGPQETVLADLVTMYLLRFTIGHFFRFVK